MIVVAQVIRLAAGLPKDRYGPEARAPLMLDAEVVHPGGPCVPSPVPLPDELHDLTVAPDAEVCARKALRVPEPRYTRIVPAFLGVNRHPRRSAARPARGVVGRKEDLVGRVRDRRLGTQGSGSN